MGLSPTYTLGDSENKRIVRKERKKIIEKGKPFSLLKNSVNELDIRSAFFLPGWLVFQPGKTPGLKHKNRHAVNRSKLSYCESDCLDYPAP